MKHYDVIIVGAGSMGMAAGYYLARQGVHTLLIDAGDPPHQMGSHHGDTRIIRHAYGEGELYVPLTIRAMELWKELEEASGKRLFVQTGVLSGGPRDSRFVQNVQRVQSAIRFRWRFSARKRQLSVGRGYTCQTISPGATSLPPVSFTAKTASGPIASKRFSTVQSFWSTNG